MHAQNKPEKTLNTFTLDWFQDSGSCYLVKVFHVSLQRLDKVVAFSNAQFFFFHFLNECIYLFFWERDSMSMSSGKEAEGGGKQNPHLAETQCRARSKDPKIMPHAEGRYLTDWAIDMPLNGPAFKQSLQIIQNKGNIGLLKGAK